MSKSKSVDDVRLRKSSGTVNHIFMQMCKNFSNDQFPGQSEPTAWPPHLPELLPVDFCKDM